MVALKMVSCVETLWRRDYIGGKLTILARDCQALSRQKTSKVMSCPAGWRMASTAMRLVIIAARAVAFYVLIGGLHSEFSLP